MEHIPDKPETFRVEDPHYGQFVPSTLLYNEGRIVQGDYMKALVDAGVAALRTRYHAINMTVYPTTEDDIRIIHGVHIAVRTGNFSRITECVERLQLFGLVLDVDVHNWLLKSEPGKPLEDIVDYLRTLRRAGGKSSIMEAQVLPSIYEKVIRRGPPSSALFRKIEAKLNFHELHFDLPVYPVYLREDDWDRIVTRGEQDTMDRAEASYDLWKLWFMTASRYHNLTWDYAKKLTHGKGCHTAT